MDGDLKRRLERLEQPAAAEGTLSRVIQARAKAGRMVDKLIAMIRRGEPVESFGSPIPDGPAEPSPACVKLLARLEEMAQAVENP